MLLLNFFPNGVPHDLISSIIPSPSETVHSMFNHGTTNIFSWQPVMTYTLSVYDGNFSMVERHAIPQDRKSRKLYGQRLLFMKEFLETTKYGSHVILLGLWKGVSSTLESVFSVSLWQVSLVTSEL